MKTNIPKILHQIWLGTKKAPLKFMQTWKDKHPDFEYFLWTEELLKKHFPNGLYNQMKLDLTESPIGKSDIIRYEILYTFGGIYVDADSICIKRLDDFILDNACFACWENEEKRPGLIVNSFLGAKPKNAFLKLLMEAIHQFPDYLFCEFPPWEITGPNLITEMYKNTHHPELTIYPSHFFNPYHFENKKISISEYTYAFHLFSSSLKESSFHHEKVDEDIVLKKVFDLIKHTNCSPESE